MIYRYLIMQALGDEKFNCIAFSHSLDGAKVLLDEFKSEKPDDMFLLYELVPYVK